MAITIAQAFTSLLRTKKNLGDVSDAARIAWSDTVNEQIYNRISKINPEDYITEFLVDVSSGVSSYTRPIDYKNMNIIETGLFKTTSGTTYGRLRYDAETGAFTEGLTVTGGSSGATGVIDELHDDGTTGYFKLSSVSGTFEDDEAITDSSTGVAVVNGTLQAYKNTDTPLEKTGQASAFIGWYERGTSIIMTPEPSGNALYNMRYTPKLTKFTATTESFVDIPTESGIYLEMITDLLNVQYEKVQLQSLTPAEAEEVANNTMDDFFGEIAVIPNTYFTNTGNIQY